MTYGTKATYISLRVYREEEVFATLHVKVGSISLNTGRPSPIPNRIKEAFSVYK